MNKDVDTIVAIGKEAIEKLNFPEQEVLLTQEQINSRLYEAERATKLGNYFKDKVKIIFEDSEGMKMVETTVWGVTDRKLILKRGIALPLYRVHDIII